MRWLARSQPWAIGVWGSIAPMNVTSSPSGSNTRNTTNRSASAVEEETKSFAASGPVISISSLVGWVRKVSPSPVAS